VSDLSKVEAHAGSQSLSLGRPSRGSVRSVVLVFLPEFERVRGARAWAEELWPRTWVPARSTWSGALAKLARYGAGLHVVRGDLGKPVGAEAGGIGERVDVAQVAVEDDDRQAAAERPGRSRCSWSRR